MPAWFHRVSATGDPKVTMKHHRVVELFSYGRRMVINQFYNSKVLWIPTIRIPFIQQKDSHHEVHEYVPAQGTHDYAILMLPPVLKL